MGGGNAVGAEQCRHGDLAMARQGDQFGAGDAQRQGDAVEPIDRNRAGAGFQPPDGLRRGRRIAERAYLFERQPLRLADLTDAGDHGTVPYNLFGFPFPTDYPPWQVQSP